MISSNSKARLVVQEDSRAQFLAPTPQAGFKQKRRSHPRERLLDYFFLKFSFTTAQRAKCESAESQQDQRSWLRNSHGIIRRIDNFQSEIAYVEEASI